MTQKGERVSPPRTAWKTVALAHLRQLHTAQQHAAEDRQELLELEDSRSAWRLLAMIMTLVSAAGAAVFFWILTTA